MNKTLLGIFQQTNSLKSGRAKYRGGPQRPKSGGPWPARPNSFRRLWLLISENGSVLWRRHSQLTYKQVRATHQSSISRQTRLANSASVEIISWCTLYFSGENLLMANQPLFT